MDYWKECISEAFDDAKIVATDDQIGTVAYWAEGAHDNFSMAHGHDCIPNPLANENDRLVRELVIEKAKVICEVCNGRGRIIIQGPCHSSESECWTCKGEGRHN